ncbi:MAG: beta-galactosidase [Blautia sp.]|nr:beta-galactosidase [Blautia sp.]MCM1201457.1 beta-galactosidase [Bacteroides fragilis]
MIENDKVQKILYGGDYNPEQWPEDVWEEDMRLFRLAHIDIVTLNVFSWASLQPNEDTYSFEKLDKIMDMVRQSGLKVCLATSTAAHPAWMARKYPDILRTEFNGMKRKFGGRHNSCPNSPAYRKYAGALAARLAERYQSYDNIVAWHISNEFGGICYCENCERRFREWLREKYKTIEEVNRVWDTAFWGHTFYDFDDIVTPNLLSEHFTPDRTTFQGISLDYRRFNSESILACYRLEYDAIRAITPDIPITTNLMGTYPDLDYQKWARYMDFISWDNYPANDTPIEETAFRHDLMRGLKQGKPFALMEQTPSVTNWLPYNALKRPGVMRLWSYQAVAHGADTVMFFQMRRSVGACEKYHGAVIDHVGHENTRVFREIAQLGAELDKIGSLTLGARTDAKAAIVFDWDNWWATGYSAGPSVSLRYCDEILQYYKAFHNLNIPVDIIGVEDDLSPYKLVAAPLLYMVKTGHDEKLRRFVSDGGHFLTTFFSGYVDEHDLVTTGGYPGRLRDILGIWVEEEDALPENEANSFTYQGTAYPAVLICDLLHTEGAEALCFYEKDFYAGMPVLTRNSFGKGYAYYVAARSSADFYRRFIGDICRKAGVEPLMDTPELIEVTQRRNANGVFLFFLNHDTEAREIPLPFAGTDILTDTSYRIGECLKLAAKGVAILRIK